MYCDTYILWLPELGCSSTIITRGRVSPVSSGLAPVLAPVLAPLLVAVLAPVLVAVLAPVLAVLVVDEVE